jgi:hypothetical protein
MRPQIQELVDQHLAAMIADGPPTDLVRDFALPVPSLVIALLLGVPAEDLEFFQHNTTVGMDMRSSEEQKAQAFGAMYTYIQELVERKGHDPGDDLISRLVTDYVSTGQLNRATAATTGVIMMQAGHETTANMIALGTVALLQHPEVFERLGQTDDWVVIANIVEGLMRYLTIVHSQVDRVATEDFTLGGQFIRAGDMVVMNLPAGNWERRVRRQSGSLRRRAKYPRALRVRLRRASMYRTESRQGRDADRVRHIGPPPTRAATSGVAARVEVQGRVGYLRHEGTARHVVKSNELRFDEQVAVISGAGAGLGKQYALLLASRGARILVNDIGGSVTGDGSSTEAANAVTEEIRQRGGQAGCAPQGRVPPDAACLERDARPAIRPGAQHLLGRRNPRRRAHEQLRLGQDRVDRLYPRAGRRRY